MTKRQQDILDLLKTGEQTTSAIGMTLGCPEPSVRRTIQELIRKGYNISFALNGRYCMKEGY